MQSSGVLQLSCFESLGIKEESNLYSKNINLMQKTGTGHNVTSINSANIGRSELFFEQAQKVIPGGVNSPVRAFKSVGGTPRFMKKGDGCYIFDVDGNKYIDYVGGWGPLILGHAHPKVSEALSYVINDGWAFGSATYREIELAEIIIFAMPSIEKIRFVNSGTEACMTALRLARAATGRQAFLKFEGCYHGHADPFLVKAGSGLLTFGLPSSSGVGNVDDLGAVVAAYNDVTGLEKIFASLGDKLAAVILEPVAGNMGVVLPDPEFLTKVEQLAKQYGVTFILDEVITGFRLCFGGAQNIYNLKPDLTCLGKIIGGGLPIGAIGGRADLMEQLAPLGPVYQAGTLSGNSMSMACGIATLKRLKEVDPYKILEKLGTSLENGILEEAKASGIPIILNRAGSMFTMFFSSSPVNSHHDLKNVGSRKFAIFFHALLNAGVLLPPSAFEAAFISTAHGEEDITDTIKAIGNAFRKL